MVSVPKVYQLLLIRAVRVPGGEAIPTQGPAGEWKRPKPEIQGKEALPTGFAQMRIYAGDTLKFVLVPMVM